MRARDLIAFSAILILDQLSKSIFLKEGLIFQNNRLGLALPVIALIIIVLGTTRLRKKHASLALALIIGGGVSNIIDLLTRGFITDYLYIKSFYFNIADIAILTGVLLLIIHMNKHVENIVYKSLGLRKK